MLASSASIAMIDLLTTVLLGWESTAGLHLGYTTLCKVIGVRKTVLRWSGGRKYFPSYNLCAHNSHTKMKDSDVACGERDKCWLCPFGSLFVT